MFFIGLIIFGALWIVPNTLMALFGERTLWVITGIFWLVLGTAILLWCLPDIKRTSINAARDWGSVLRRNQAHVTRVRSTAVAEFREEEDEGNCYAFQTASDELLFVCGQDYYRTRTFPNSDFSMIDILMEDGTARDGWIETHGSRLKPLRTFPPQKGRNYRLPLHLQKVHGNLRNIRKLLG